MTRQTMSGSVPRRMPVEGRIAIESIATVPVGIVHADVVAVAAVTAVAVTAAVAVVAVAVAVAVSTFLYHNFQQSFSPSLP